MSSDELHSNATVEDTYRKRAAGYEASVNRFEVFSSLGFSLSAWRNEAVSELNLQKGDTVVDLGCGTGLNFSLIQNKIGPTGRLLGVDLSAEMLHEARVHAEQQGWQNVDLVQADISEFELPERVNAVLSTFVFILVPRAGEAVTRICRSLEAGARFVMLDMAWPKNYPFWFRHVLFFLKSYGVTEELLQCHPWLAIQESMAECFDEVFTKRYWFDFFYLCSGSSIHLPPTCSDDA